MEVVDDQGALLGMISARSHAFLTTPPTVSPLKGLIGRPQRNSAGFLEYEHSKVERQPQERAQAAPEQRRNPVTADLSVAIAGFRRSLFRPSDALFLSAALAIDIAVMLSTREARGRRITSTHTPSWIGGTPVPIDFDVLEIFGTLVRAAREGPAAALLDRTDLLCAATAILYQAPMYTTQPEAYARLKNGLRVIEYGPVRDRAAERALVEAGAREHQRWVDFVRSQPPLEGSGVSAWSPGTSVAPAGEDPLLTHYRAGEPFDARALDILRRAAADGTDLTPDIFVILADPYNLDHTWRIRLLEHANEYASAVQHDSPWHINLMLTVDQVAALAAGSGFEERLRESSLVALGLWGHWPTDASADVLQSLAIDPTDELLLRYYRAYLEMAGLPAAVVNSEVDGVREGTVTPSAERIDELTREYGGGRSS
jgi:hypothetical protein